ncbi:1838_t:CDS:1, partial [Scutellospora calospora]
EFNHEKSPLIVTSNNVLTHTIKNYDVIKDIVIIEKKIKTYQNHITYTQQDNSYMLEHLFLFAIPACLYWILIIQFLDLKGYI